MSSSELYRARRREGRATMIARSVAHRALTTVGSTIGTQSVACHAGAGGGMVDGAGPVELVDGAVGGGAGGALVDAAASAAICK